MKREQPLTDAELQQVALRGRAVTVGDLERTLAHLRHFYKRTQRYDDADRAGITLECFQLATGLPHRTPDEILSPTPSENA